MKLLLIDSCSFDWTEINCLAHLMHLDRFDASKVPSQLLNGCILRDTNAESQAKTLRCDASWCGSNGSLNEI